MAHIKIIIQDSASPFARDDSVRDIITGMGHTYVYESHTEPENITGFDGILVLESVFGGTVGTKYKTVAIPVVAMENGIWDDYDMHTRTGIGNTTTLTTDTQDDTIFVNAPSSGNPYTILSSLNALNYAPSANAGPGVQNIASRPGSGSSMNIFAYETGATMLNSYVAPARRVGLMVEVAVDSIFTFTLDGITIMEDMFIWAYGAVVLGATVTTQPIKNYSGALEVSQTGYTVNFYSKVDGTLVLRQTGISTDASGIITIQDVALTATTIYRMDIENSGGLYGSKDYTAA